MKKLFIIGNWKSYKTSVETEDWFQEITNYKLQITNEKTAILCVPFTLLALAKSLIIKYNLPLKLGAQDISPFGEGKYTGEINGKQIAEFADYVIIGHSERRENFAENEKIITKKLEQAFAYGLTPIVCVSEVSQCDSLIAFCRDHKNMVIAYEPLFAIGSGQADTPENAEKTSAEIQLKMENLSIIYGGSVTSQNVRGFTSTATIEGVLPGGASLDATEFASIINNA